MSQIVSVSAHDHGRRELEGRGVRREYFAFLQPGVYVQLFFNM
jgi:hypothetical protein